MPHSCHPFRPLCCPLLPGAMLGTSLLCLSFAGAVTRAWQVCGSATWQQEGPSLAQSTTPGFPRSPVYVSLEPVSPNRSLGPQTSPQDLTSCPTCFCEASTLGSLLPSVHTLSHTCAYTLTGAAALRPPPASLTVTHPHPWLWHGRQRGAGHMGVQF